MELYCLYQDPAPRSLHAYCGTVNVKTRQGLAVVAFATPELAAYFSSVFGVRGRVVKLSELGSEELPLRPKPPVTVPKKLFLLPSKGVLSAWADDRAGFDTAPFVTSFAPPRS